MKRWSTKHSENIEDSKIDLFLAEVIVLERKYNLSISHEDDQGAFLIEEFSENNARWLNTANANI